MLPTHQYKDSAAGEEPHQGKTSPTPIDQIAQIQTDLIIIILQYQITQIKTGLIPQILEYQKTNKNKSDTLNMNANASRLAWYGFRISSLPPNTSLHPVL